MTIYPPEPTTAAEVMARARQVESRRRAELARARTETLRPQENHTPSPPQEAAAISPSQHVKRMIAEVAEQHGVTVQEIVGEHRTTKIFSARGDAICLVAAETGWSASRLGRLFNRDHSTILNVLRKARDGGTKVDRAKVPQPVCLRPRPRRHAPDKIAAICALKGTKLATLVGVEFGLSRDAVIGIWRRHSKGGRS